jgi:hypothetical protein
MAWPLKREEVALVVSLGLRKLLARPDLNLEQRETLAGLLAHEPLGSFGDLVNAVIEGIPSQPGAIAALSAANVAGFPHPWLAWLDNGGCVWIYGLAASLASTLGRRLPALPIISTSPAIAVSGPRLANLD